MLNQRVQGPFGNITTFRTPKTDAFVQEHRREEKADTRRLEDQVDDLDRQLSSQLGNILNPDIPELTQKWQDYKQSKKQLLFDKKLQSDPNAYAQKQIEVNRKLGDAMQLIGDSSKRKQLLAAQLPDYYKNPHKYEDDFTSRYNQSLNTPTSIARKDPNTDNHVWAGVDLDFTKKVNDASGKDVKLNPRSVVKGESTEYTPITGFNDPVTFKSKLDASNTDRKYSTNASKAYRNLSEAEINSVNQQYAALPKERFKDWGMDAAPNLDPKNPDDQAEAYNSYLAKKHAINATFKEGKPEVVVDKEKKRQLDMKDWMDKAGVSQKMRVDLLNRRQAFTIANKDSNTKDDDASAWVNVGKEVLTNGTPAQKQAYLSNLGTGGGKGVKYIATDASTPVPSIKYTKATWVPELDKEGRETNKGTWEDKQIVQYFDPSDPEIEIKLVNAYNEMKGKNLKLIRRTFNKDKIETTGKEEKSEKQKPAVKVKKADKGILD